MYCVSNFRSHGGAFSNGASRLLKHSLLSERSPSDLLTLLYFSALQSASLRERGIGLTQTHMASRQLLVVCKRLWATELRWVVTRRSKVDKHLSGHHQCVAKGLQSLNPWGVVLSRESCPIHFLSV